MKDKYKRASNWCYKCDRAYVEIGKKCPVCGHRERKKISKITQKDLIEQSQGDNMSETKFENFRDYVLAKEKEGVIVIATFEGFAEIKLDDVIHQLTDGLLYDLNRDRATILTFIEDKKWVNDFACMKVIVRLKELLEEQRDNSIDKLELADQEFDIDLDNNLLTKVLSSQPADLDKIERGVLQSEPRTIKDISHEIHFADGMDDGQQSEQQSTMTLVTDTFTPKAKKPEQSSAEVDLFSMEQFQKSGLTIDQWFNKHKPMSDNLHSRQYTDADMIAFADWIVDQKWDRAMVQGFNDDGTLKCKTTEELLEQFKRQRSER